MVNSKAAAKQLHDLLFFCCADMVHFIYGVYILIILISGMLNTLADTIYTFHVSKYQLPPGLFGQFLKLLNIFITIGFDLRKNNSPSPH